MAEEPDADGTDGAFDSAAYRHVGSVAAVRREERVVVEDGNREVVVFHSEGRFFAVLNHCVHQGAPIRDGRITGMLDEDEQDGLVYTRQGEILACPAHGWEFDLLTGEHLARPDDYRIPTFDVVVRDGQVYVDL